jgi:hypothetical protein
VVRIREGRAKDARIREVISIYVCWASRAVTQQRFGQLERQKFSLGPRSRGREAVGRAGGGCKEGSSPPAIGVRPGISPGKFLKLKTHVGEFYSACWIQNNHHSTLRCTIDSCM